jgi:hypothetical protein
MVTSPLIGNSISSLPLHLFVLVVQPINILSLTDRSTRVECSVACHVDFIWLTATKNVTPVL